MQPSLARPGAVARQGVTNHHCLGRQAAERLADMSVDAGVWFHDAKSAAVKVSVEIWEAALDGLCVGPGEVRAHGHVDTRSAEQVDGLESVRERLNLADILGQLCFQTGKLGRSNSDTEPLGGRGESQWLLKNDMQVSGLRTAAVRDAHLDQLPVWVVARTDLQQCAERIDDHGYGRPTPHTYPLHHLWRVGVMGLKCAADFVTIWE